MRTMDNLPGEPLESGFDFRPRTSDDNLSADAVDRINTMIDSSNAARRKAKEEASGFVL